MGGLSIFFEEAGLSTTGISLIRINTEKVAPPRALWVPFELGRPLGAPSDPAFQRRVLVRVSFPEPDASSRAEIWRKLTPSRAPMAADVDYDALGARFEITGGYIKNAMLAAVPAL